MDKGKAQGTLMFGFLDFFSIRCLSCLTLVFALAQHSPLASAQVAVTTYHNDTARTGQNLQEAVLTPGNVNVGSFGKVFSYQLPPNSYVYAQPLVLPNVTIPDQGTYNLVFVATEQAVVYAFDADGIVPNPIWQASLGSPVPSFPYAQFIGPSIGVTGTPVIDQSSNTIYVVSKVLDPASGQPVDQLHALDVATGNEKFGGPVNISASVIGAGAGSIDGTVTFDPTTANQRAGLLLSNGVIYIAWGGYQDTPNYHGWLMAYDTTSLQQLAAFNTTPNGGETSGDGRGGGIWTNGGIAADDSGAIYAGIGNGTFDGANVDTPNNDYGESLVKLQPLSLSLADFFTPFNVQDLNDRDLDVGGGLLLLPDQPSASPHLLISAGKEGRIYVLNRDNLGQFNASGDQIVQSIEGGVGGSGCGGVATDGCNRTTPAFWQNQVYFHGQGDVLKAFTLSSDPQPLSSSPTSQASITYPFRGASPSISANGSTSGIVWELRVDESGFDAPSAVLYAYDANSLNELYDSGQNPADDAGQGQSFILPTVANGKVYVATRNAVSIYGLLPNSAP